MSWPVVSRVDRLAVFHGMETRHDDLKFSARGLDLDELLVEFESMARRAFNRVDDAMASLDDLHNQPVHDLTQALVRVGQEYELPERVILDMTARAPEFLNGQDPTMFTVVDMVTNEANNPAIRNRLGVRHQLEQVGGHVAIDPASRCDKCESRLNQLIIT